MKSTLFFVLPLLILSSCNQGNNTSDASGVFEADEVIVSAEQPGKLVSFNVNEGDIPESADSIFHTIAFRKNQ
jgi:HlyD family secretion protein